MTKNLLSIYKITRENNVLVEFSADDCVVKDKNSQEILLRGFLQNGLYQLAIPLRTSVSSPGEFNTQAHGYQTSLQSSLSSESTSFLQPCNSSIVSDKKSDVNKDVLLWHRRLGHPHAPILSSVMEQLHVKPSNANKINFCEACQFGKLHQNVFPSSTTKSTKPFELVHADVWGPSPIVSSTGFRYYLLFVDDFTRYSWIYPFKFQSEVASIVMQFHKLVEQQFDTKVRIFQSDWGGEFRNLVTYFASQGIHFRHPCPPRSGRERLRLPRTLMLA